MTMPTTSAGRTHELDQVLVDVALLLVERTRKQLEGEAAESDELRRARELEDRLKSIREHLPAPMPLAAEVGRQPSRFYETPGQEDA